jgi:flagellar hook assembly protein FlgD
MTHRIKALQPDEMYVDTLNWIVNTTAGTQQFFAEINPLVGQYYDQQEQFHFNNILQLALQTRADVVNPILDVTFDGIHILDGDLVSATPTIVMSLDDENPYLLLNTVSDTANYRVFLAQPNSELLPLYFSNDDISFVPAANSQNKSKVIYTPTFIKDGRYTLQVQAKDRSGNYSGDQEYRINFEVETASTISEVFNYPNPFSTSTRFLFTLSGSEVPDEMKIQIMNISGDIVREIMGDELGTLRIGRNLTEYAWDGRDEFGDPLANGVYLYRVIARLKGNDMEFKSRGGAEFFQKGFGKMYIMR